MGVFKCVYCGAEKETDKECSCSICGYRMYEAPFNRDEMLKNEIKKFIYNLRIKKIQYGSLEIYRKAYRDDNKNIGNEHFMRIEKQEDDDRFPDCAKIKKYIFAHEKMDLFHERLRTSVEQIRTYMNASYAQEYSVSFKRINKEINELDSVLKAALKAMDIHFELPEVNLPEMKLYYSEKPNAEFVIIAETVLDDILALDEKIKKFIRQNNIYGTNYNKKIKNAYRMSDKNNYLSDLKKCADCLREVLAKKYVIDILSDGLDELNEMMNTLWQAIEVILSIPIFEKNYIYTLDDNTIVGNEQLNDFLLERIERRYHDAELFTEVDNILFGKSEDELFALYKKMITLDIYGFIEEGKKKSLEITESEKRLNELIGLTDVKESIQKIKAYVMYNRESENLNIHMCFVGNPGTGKTEVARCIAEILYENKILPTKKVVEVDRSGLVSQYFGATAEKTKNVIESAMGGVLFIDEAYALGNNAEHGVTDYGREAIDTLVKAMEDYRGKFCVIFAGYKNEILQMLSINPGLKSRIQFILDFPNYSRQELQSIIQLMLKQRQYSISDIAMSKILDITDIKRKEVNFANAREIRNILDQVIMCQNIRCMDSKDKEIGIVDVSKYINDAKINLPIAKEGMNLKVLSGEEELEQLIGLSSVKHMVKKIKAYAKRNKNEDEFNLHMCFYGNPGTGKTEVARILSRILYDAGVLAEAKLVETNAYELRGRSADETVNKTKGIINEAMNGVLFIDEAYGLIETSHAIHYGGDALAILLKEMEDHRGKFCVILAGYKKEMQEMFHVNTGFKSRIQFTIEFPDYTKDELREIAKTFLFKRQYEIELDAMECILDVLEYLRHQPDFANARMLRNVIEQVLLNQNLRTDSTEGDNVILLEDVEDYLLDEGIQLHVIS